MPLSLCGLCPARPVTGIESIFVPVSEKKGPHIGCIPAVSSDRGKPWLRQASCAPLRTGEPEVQRLTAPRRTATWRTLRDPTRSCDGEPNRSGSTCAGVSFTECVNLARASWCYDVPHLTSAAIWAGRWRSVKSCPNSGRPDRVTVRCFHAEPRGGVFIDSSYH